GLQIRLLHVLPQRGAPAGGERNARNPSLPVRLADVLRETDCTEIVFKTASDCFAKGQSSTQRLRSVTHAALIGSLNLYRRIQRVDARCEAWRRCLYDCCRAALAAAARKRERRRLARGLWPLRRSLCQDGL